MGRAKAMLAVVLAAFSLVFVSAAAQAQSDITFRFQSEYKYKAQVKFFSQDRKGYEWPGGGKAYNLDDSDVHAIKLKCLGGEKICYGGWVTGNAKLYWGVGADGKNRCTSCCFTCNGGQTPVLTLK
jgi:hypothetical protein